MVGLEGVLICGRDSIAAEETARYEVGEGREDAVEVRADGVLIELRDFGIGRDGRGPVGGFAAGREGRGSVVVMVK